MIPQRLTPICNTQYFLQSVRQGRGVLCTKDLKRHWANHPFSDPREALELVRHFRQAHDVYCTMGTLREGEGQRAADNIERLNGFYLDIDCHGKDGEYQDLREAAKALKKFCTTTQLPLPGCLVDSGYGLHVHWPLEAPALRAQWKQVADKLKALSKTCGLKADPTVTADPARVLRVPGTFNFRDPKNPVAVELVPAPGEPSALQKLEAAVDRALGATPRKICFAAQRPLAAVRGGVLFKGVEDTPRQRAQVMELLRHVSANCGYELYRDMVWATLSLGWNDAGDIAERWCRTAPDRFEEHDFRGLVNSYDETRTPTLGTIIYHARAGGWNG